MTDRCKERVWDATGFGRERRCQRRAALDGYCRQHHPDTVAERRRKADEEFNEQSKARRLKREAVNALRLIAAGHDDPAGLARDILAKYGPSK